MYVVHYTVVLPCALGAHILGEVFLPEPLASDNGGGGGISVLGGWLSSYDSMRIERTFSGTYIALPTRLCDCCTLHGVRDDGKVYLPAWMCVWGSYIATQTRIDESRR